MAIFGYKSYGGLAMRAWLEVGNSARHLINVFSLPRFLSLSPSSGLRRLRESFSGEFVEDLVSDDDRETMAVEPPSEINLEDILANLLVPDNAVIKQVRTWV